MQTSYNYHGGGIRSNKLYLSFLKTIFLFTLLFIAIFASSHNAYAASIVCGNHTTSDYLSLKGEYATYAYPDNRTSLEDTITVQNGQGNTSGYSGFSSWSAEKSGNDMIIHIKNFYAYTHGASCTYYTNSKGSRCEASMSYYPTTECNFYSPDFDLYKKKSSSSRTNTMYSIDVDDYRNWKTGENITAANGWTLPQPLGWRMKDVCLPIGDVNIRVIDAANASEIKIASTIVYDYSSSARKSSESFTYNRFFIFKLHTHSDSNNDGICDGCGVSYRSAHTMSVEKYLNGTKETGSGTKFHVSVSGRSTEYNKTSYSSKIADGTWYSISPTCNSGYRYLGNGNISRNMPGNNQTEKLYFTTLYSIHFNSNFTTKGVTTPTGSSTSNMDNIPYADSKTLTPNGFYRYGYTFSGWNTKADGTGQAYSDKQTVSKLTSTPGGVINLYAQWKPNTYSIYYTLYGANGNTTLTRNYNTESESFTLQDPSLSGYIFKGWVGGADAGDREFVGNTYDNPTKGISISKGNYGDKFFRAILERVHNTITDENGNKVYADSIFIAQSKPIETSYAKNAYRIVYNLGGGELNNAKYYFSDKDLGYVPPAPTRTGCNFVRWEPASLNKIPANRTTPFTFTAVWETPSLGKIKYDLAGGSISNQKTSYTADDYGYEPPTPTRAKYTFAGWSPLALPYNVTGDVTFTATWTPAAIGNITYNLNGGTISGAKTSYTVDDYGYTPPKPTRNGYTFAGWDHDTIPDGSTGNITFTAKWTENVMKIRFHSDGADRNSLGGGTYVTFDKTTSEDGDTADTIFHTEVFHYGTVLPAKIPSEDNISPNTEDGFRDPNWLERDGYHLEEIHSWNWRLLSQKGTVRSDENFTGWTGAKVADFIGVLSNFNDGDITVDFYPMWEANTYTVKYNTNAPTGTTVSGTMADDTFTYNETKALSANSYTIDNYSFLYWNTKPDGTGDTYTDGITISNLTQKNGEMINLYAQWNKNILGQITYNLDGGKFEDSTDVKTEYTANDYGYVPPAPVKDGYTFVSWSPESIANGKTGNITFKATWKNKTTVLTNYLRNELSNIADSSSSVYTIQIDSEAPSRLFLLKNATVISAKDSYKEVYAWFADNTIHIWSEADTIYMPENSERVFASFYNLQQIKNFGKLNTSKVKNMCGMFAKGSISSSDVPLTIIDGIDTWDVSNVKNMSRMFYGCIISNPKSLDLSKWDVSNVTNMSYMFEGSGFTNLSNLSKWNVSNVTNMSYMFEGSSYVDSITDLRGLSTWNVSNVTDMSHMFYGNDKLSNLTGLSQWDVGNVTNMSYMFAKQNASKAIKINNPEVLNNWNIQKVTDFRWMFFYKRYTAGPHPEFTKRTGTWDEEGTFTPTN